MALYLSGLPLWLALLLIVIIPTLIAMSGPIFLRRCFGREHLVSNNEIAGFKFAVVGVIYSVLVAFAIIVVWEKFNDAEIAVMEEAGAAATLYRSAQGSEPGLVAIRSSLTNYLKLAVDKDWPAMAKKSESREVTEALNALYTVVLHATDGSKQKVMVSEMFKQLDTLTLTRRTRLHLALGIVPGVVWLVLSCGAVLTVVFTFFFGAKNLPAQVMMTGILSVLVFMALLVIVSIDYPFTGPSHVGTGPLDAVIEDFGS